MEINNYRLCDQVIFKRHMPDNPEVQIVRDDYLTYLDEIIEDIRCPPRSPRYFSTVSLSLVYLTKKLKKRYFVFTVTVDPRLISYWQNEYSYADVFDKLDLWDREWHYAHMFTVGVVSQQILRLPELARQYHVVVVGPRKLVDLHQRWGLDPARYTFFAAPRWPPSRPDGNVYVDPILPPLTTFRARHRMLERLAQVRSGVPKMYLFEAGTCSQWWIDRLFRRDPDNFYMDLGRVLELWYPDYPWPLRPRITRFYRRAAKNYYGEQKYQQLFQELLWKREKGYDAQESGDHQYWKWRGIWNPEITPA